MESLGQFFADAGEWIRSLELNRNTIVEALLVAAILAVVGAAGAGLHSLWRRRIQRRLAESAPKPSIELWGSTFAPETANPKQWILVVPPETDVVVCPMQLTLINPTESPIEQPILVL